MRSLKNPSRTPSGYFHGTDTIELWVKYEKTDPMTGKALRLEELSDVTAEEKIIAETDTIIEQLRVSGIDDRNVEFLKARFHILESLVEGSRGFLKLGYLSLMAKIQAALPYRIETNSSN